MLSILSAYASKGSGVVVSSNGTSSSSTLSSFLLICFIYILASATAFFLSALNSGSLASCPNGVPTLPTLSAILAAKLATSSSIARLATSTISKFNRSSLLAYCIDEIGVPPGLSSKLVGTINSRSAESDRSPSSTLSSP